MMKVCCTISELAYSFIVRLYIHVAHKFFTLLYNNVYDIKKVSILLE